MRKIFAVTTLLLFSLAIVAPSAVWAASPRVSASLTKNRRAVSVTFVNLTKVKSITYNLTYDSDKGLQGIGGTISLKRKTSRLSRTLVLGTCSHNVCTYHRNVANLKLTVDFTLSNGGAVSYEKNLR